MNLNNILAKAQKMMLDENFNRQVEMAAAAQRGQSTGDDFSAAEAELFGYSSTPTGYAKNELPENVNYNRTQTGYDGVAIIQPVQEKRDMSTSKLPKAILESFEKTPSPVDAFDTGVIDTSQLNFLNTDKPQQKQQIREQAPRQTTVPQNSSIDYNYIKYLINEAIKENLNKLNESANVNNFRGMRIAPGNVFQFIDTKGNLYEGQLKLKKKASK